MRILLTVTTALTLAACSDGADNPPVPGDANSDPAATRPAGEPRLVTVEGRVEQGTECSIIRTPDGEVWSVNFGEADFGPGDYIRLTGEIADASICMQGQGTLIPQDISEIEPPARDRDPARAGGIALTAEYLRGSWTPKGGNCERPAFQISDRRGGGLSIETRVNGYPATGKVVTGDLPRIEWDDDLPLLPLESRGPDGVAILPTPTETSVYDPVMLAGTRIGLDGAVFIRCA